MLKFLILTATICCIVIETQGACEVGATGGNMTFCTGRPGFVSRYHGVKKFWPSANCMATPILSNQECIVLPAGNWMSGHAGGPYSCSVYKRTDCRGKFQSVDENGLFTFYEPVVAFRCPCRVI